MLSHGIYMYIPLIHWAALPKPQAFDHVLQSGGLLPYMVMSEGRVVGTCLASVSMCDEY